MRTTEPNSKSVEITSFSLDNIIINTLSDKVNAVFQRNLAECYTTFCEICQPLVSKSELNILIEEYKNTFPSHYDLMTVIFNIKHKVTLTHNCHLIDHGYYDKLIF